MEERELSSYQANRRRAGIAVLLSVSAFYYPLSMVLLCMHSCIVLIRHLMRVQSPYLMCMYSLPS